MPSVGDQVLSGGYTLAELLDESGDRQSWRATTKIYLNEVLLKTWKFHGAEPDPVQQALFNVELRTLFRVSGLPGVDESILTIRDAGIMRGEGASDGCFIVVLNTVGFRTLQDLLAERGKHEWLSQLDVLGNRIVAWRNFRRIAQGLARLHDCQMLHRAISPRVIYLDPTGQPDGMRLGGFEWTVRLTSGDSIVLPPPGMVDPARPFSFESDWFAFGSLLATVFAGADVSPQDKHYVKKLIEAVRQSGLHDQEQHTITQFLGSSYQSQHYRSEMVLHALDQLIETLERPQREGIARLALVCALGEGQKLTQAVVDRIREESPDSDVSAMRLRPQLDFIQRDLRKARVVRNRDGKSFILIGQKLSYLVWEYKERGMALRAWQIAFCTMVGGVTYSAGSGDQADLEGVTITPFDVRGFLNNHKDIIDKAADWAGYLPMGHVLRVQQRLQQYQEFFRVTNQVECLMRNAEIFQYELLSYNVIDGVETAEVREVPRALPDYLKRYDMITMLAHEFSGPDPDAPPQVILRNDKDRDTNYVFLGPEQSLSLTRRIEEREYWQITTINPDRGVLVLKRMADGANERPPNTGYLRSRGMFGQVHLLVRRKKAIDRLLDHAYLLRSFLDPDQNYIDTKVESLPSDINEGLPENRRLDQAKAEAITRIWQTRPLFVLQGPPGTGKTTLVAALLKQIFRESEVSQVLVTAQAHPAVDVLRRRVDEAFGESADQLRRPLIIRIPRSLNKDELESDSDYPIPVARSILQRAYDMIDENTSIPVQQEWRGRIKKLLTGLRTEDEDAASRDFVELVERSANLTYSSSTSGALAEQLAESPLSFDWSIIEEAGKAHGFDLVLPLQNAYRWLLIGDHRQLPPYRAKDFLKALNNADDVMERLRALPDRRADLIDQDLIRSWNADGENGDDLRKKEHDDRKRSWQRWLKVFKDTFERCETLGGLLKADGRPPIHAMLWQQHRMHPTISELISTAFYRNPIQSMTVDKAGQPVDRVVHPFDEPDGIRGKAIVWVDVPLKKGQGGEQTDRGMYTSDMEVVATLRFLKALHRLNDSQVQVSLSVLSPYKAQVRELARKLKSFNRQPPAWLKRREGQNLVNTVDSFQGNEAGVVIVSLVRNNGRSMPIAFGFLREDERMNVTLSRAERLLVLVGSWEFFRSNLEDVSDSLDDLEPLASWKRAIDYLEECFANERAIRIPVDALPELDP